MLREAEFGAGAPALLTHTVSVAPAQLVSATARRANIGISCPSVKYKRKLDRGSWLDCYRGLVLSVHYPFSGGEVGHEA